MTQKRFQDQVAIITGGAEGLGRSLAEQYLVEGATVVLFDRNQELLKQAVTDFESLGLTNVSYIKTDISDAADVEKAFNAFDKKYDRLDIMVNSAGIVGPSNIKTSEVSVEDFDRVYNTNLRGSFLMVKYAVKRMEKRNYGRILLIASIAGKEGNAGMVCYSSTKSGVIGMVKSVGKEYAETGITINGLAPAVIQTRLVDNMPPEQVKYMTDKIPMKRCGTLQEFSSIACWITSREASFNTGNIFDLSGGRATY